MEVQLNWTGKMSFEGVGPSGFSQRFDTDTSVGGDDSAARPMEFIAMGLAGCTAMDVISILSKKKQAVTNFQVMFHGGRASEHPKVFTEAIIEYLIYGRDVEESSVVRAIALSSEKYCPAQAMLAKAFPIRLIYKIFDTETKSLLIEGEYFQNKSIS